MIVSVKIDVPELTRIPKNKDELINLLVGIDTGNVDGEVFIFEDKGE